jgi:hypothetical protein
MALAATLAASAAPQKSFTIRNLSSRDKSPEEREAEESIRPLYRPPNPGRNQRKRRKHQRRQWAAGNKKAFA